MSGLAGATLHFNKAHYLALPSHYPFEAVPVATGKPAVLFEPQQDRRLARQVATMQGQADAVVGVSTLHLFWDWFELMRKTSACVLLAQDAYPFIQALAKSTLPAEQLFSFQRVDELANRLRQIPPDVPVLVVADSWSNESNQAFAVRECLQVLHNRCGLLLLDDTQTFGLLGKSPSRYMPYGEAGGGLLPWAGIRSDKVVLITSLAKSLGTPVAVLSGSHAVLECFRQQSKTRLYCSPASPVLVRHALRTLQVHARQGGQQRRKLLGNIRLFRHLLTALGMRLEGGSLFPLQKLVLQQAPHCMQIFHAVRRYGIEPVITRSQQGACAVTFILRADHSPEALAYTAQVLGKVSRVALCAELLE